MGTLFIHLIIKQFFPGNPAAPGVAPPLSLLYRPDNFLYIKLHFHVVGGIGYIFFFLVQVNHFFFSNILA